MFIALASGAILQNRYRVISRLDKPNTKGQGKGAMGAIYLAEDLTLSCEVAIKQTLFGDDDDLAKAFHREAKLLANLRHPALPRVMSHFIEGDGQFLVMDLIRGDDLDDLRVSQGGRLPTKLALKLADQLLEVLEFLHTQQPPVIHRDIKPSNLKLTQSGQLMLLDFGIAKGTLGLMTQYSGSVQALTPAYAPPEQLEEEGTEPRSDLYSFGSTFYQLLTGQTPPHALAVRAYQLAKGKPDPLRPIHELNPEVPLEISEIFTQTLSLDIEKRPASAMVLRQKLRGEKVSTGETTTRTKRLYFAIPLAMLLLLTIIGGTYWMGKDSRAYQLRAPQPPNGQILHSESTLQVGPTTYTVTTSFGTINGMQKSIKEEVVETHIIAPDRVKIRYFRDETDTETEINGEKTSRSSLGELTGLTLVGTQSSSGWNFNLEVGTPTDSQRKKIAEFASGYSMTDNDYYPDRRFVVGETWTAGSRAVRRFISKSDDGVLSAQGTITLKLSAIVPCGSQQCARIDMVIDVTGKMVDDDNREIDIEIRGTGSNLRGLTSFVDEESQFTGQAIIRWEDMVNGRKAHFESRGPVTTKATMTLR